MNANQMTTNKVRLSYTHLDKPYSHRGDGSDAKYSTTILLPKSDTEAKARLDTAIQTAIQAGVAKQWNGVMPPKVSIPVYDGDGVRENGEPFGAECKGHWVFTANSKNPVQVVDLGLNPIISPSEIYSGVYARVCVSFFAYNYNGKRGIGCGLEAVQKLEEGEPLGGSVSVNDAFGGSNTWSETPQQTVQQTYPQQSYPQQNPQAYPQTAPQTGFQQGYPQQTYPQTVPQSYPQQNPQSAYPQTGFQQAYSQSYQQTAPQGYPQQNVPDDLLSGSYEIIGANE